MFYDILDKKRIEILPQLKFLKKVEENLSLASVEDIACMKLSAILSVNVY